MRHPDESVLRRLLEEPAGVADADRQHVAGCPQCLGGVATARRVAVRVEAVPATVPQGDIEVAGARRHGSTAVPLAARRQPATGGARTAGAGRTGAATTRAGLRHPVAAALAVAVVLTGAGAAAATDWLQVFRTEQIAPAGFSAEDLVALPDLTAYGDVVLTGDGGVREVADAAAAAAETGLDVPEVTTLPRGVGGEPVHHVAGEVAATFTFSADRAARAATEAGTTLPTPPPGLDGSQVRLVAGPGAAQVWTNQAGMPSLIVGRAVAPSAFSSAVPFATARDYVLSLPGVPEDVAAQLRTFAADGSTLPLPVPTDDVTTTTAEVDGVTATVLATRDRTMAAVVWVDDGVVTAVAGALDADEVLAVARDLR